MLEGKNLERTSLNRKNLKRTILKNGLVNKSDIAVNKSDIAVNTVEKRTWEGG